MRVLHDKTEIALSGAPTLHRPNAAITIAHVNAEMEFFGGEVQLFLLIEGLRRDGWRNVLFCPPGSHAEAHAHALGIECVSVAMRNEFDGLAVLALKYGFERTGVDLVHLHTGRATWLGGWAARLAHLQAITTRRMDREVARGFRTRLIYERLTARAVAVSPSVADHLSRGGVRPERLSTICDGIDPQRIRVHRSRDDVRRELGVSSNGLVLLSVGSLVRRKGVDVLLDALAQPPLASIDCIAWIAGAGVERARLQRRASELQLTPRVRFLGYRTDVPDLLGACDLFVMPSRREGLGVSALEAMSAGCAIVATKVGGLGFAVVHERTGLLVPPDDARALAGAVARLLTDGDARHSFALAGPQRVAESFLASQMIAAYEALYRDVLAGGKRSFGGVTGAKGNVAVDEVRTQRTPAQRL